MSGGFGAEGMGKGKGKGKESFGLALVKNPIDPMNWNLWLRGSRCGL